MEEKEKIALQRDQIRRAASILYDKLRHGVLNGLFGERNRRRPDLDPQKKCENGHNRGDVIWSMGGCCIGCSFGKGCQLSLEEQDVFDAMRRLKEVICVPDAEMPRVSPSDFEEFRPDEFRYKPSPKWIARELYKFAVAYWQYADHSDMDSELKWQRALDDTICIALGDDGKVLREFLEDAEKIESKEDLDVILDKHRGISKIVEKMHDSYEKDVVDDKDSEILVLHAIMFRMEYRFGHEYPGGDLDVYHGAIESLVVDCLKVAGLYEEGRPRIYDFENEEDYEKAAAEYEHGKKKALYAFMAEDGGLKRFPLGMYT